MSNEDLQKENEELRLRIHELEDRLKYDESLYVSPILPPLNL